MNSISTIFSKPEQTDTDPGSHTIEISDVTLDDDEPAVDVDDITPLDEDKGLADLAADVRARDEADEFILGDSIDLDSIDDDATLVRRSKSAMSFSMATRWAWISTT